jgi:hypothetical protein
LLAGAALVTLALSSPRPLRAQDTIRAVEIVRHDVFTGEVSQRFYGRIANALHMMTRDGTVRREILLKPGEPYDSALAAEGARNLRHLGVFRLVQVDTVRTDSGLVLRYTTDDGWSTKLDFRFGSTGNQAVWTIAAFEDNVLGTGAQVAFEHRATPDRTLNTFLFQRSRLFAKKVYLGAQYVDKSDGWNALGLVGVPWLSSRSRARVFLTTFGEDTRVLRFRDGVTTPVDSVRRVETVVRGDVGYAPTADPHHYLRIGLAAQMRRDDAAPWGGPSAIGRTISGEAQGWIEKSRVRFMVLEGFRNFTSQEDIDLSTTMRLGVAYAPAALSDAPTGVGPLVAVHGGIALGPTAFLTGDLRHNALYRGAGLDSGTTLLGTTAGWVLDRRQTLLAHAEGGWKEHPAAGDEFDLGLGVGPRAFADHSFTGDRDFLLTAEYRYTMSSDLWGLMGLGVAAFVDQGGAWYGGDRRRTGTDAGIGIRIGPSRATSVSVVRIDLARRFTTDRQAAGWVVVVGKGFVFQDLN